MKRDRVLTKRELKEGKDIVRNQIFNISDLAIGFIAGLFAALIMINILL